MVERKMTDILLDHASLQSESLDAVIDGYVAERIAIPSIDADTALKKATLKIVEDCGVSDEDIRESVIEYFTDDIRVDEDEVKEACIESTMENMYICEDDIAREVTDHFADDITIDEDDIKTELTDGLRETLQPQLDAFVAEVQDGYLTSPDMTSKLLEAIAAKFADCILSKGTSGDSRDDWGNWMLNQIVEETSKGVQQVMVDAFAAGRRAKAIALSYDASAEAANAAADAANAAAKGAKSALKG